jgi:hypothetical protein
MLELFRKVVYDNWIPKCWVDERYKMHDSMKFLLEALLAMAED